PRLGAVVHEDFSRQQFAANLGGMGTLDGNRAGSLSGIFRGIPSPAPRFCALEEARGHAHRFVPDRRDAHGIQDVESWLAGIERWNVGRAVEVAERIV